MSAEPAELGVIAGEWERMELLDDAGRLLDWRIDVGGDRRAVPRPAGPARGAAGNSKP